MKYKVLVSGKSSFVLDFLTHTNGYFHSISTSDYFYDVIEHFKFFQPDVYVNFISSDVSSDTLLANINRIKDDINYNKAPVIIVGSVELCEELKRRNPAIADLFINRPISADNIALRIMKFFEDIEKKEKLSQMSDAEESTSEKETKKQLLVVDDDRNILKMIKTALEDKYEITTMINGILVEKYLDTKDVDLIILDYEMPMINGLDVFKKIKAHEKGKDIPVCFLTGVADTEKIIEIMKLKPHGYLLKPIDMNMLKSTLSNLID